MTVARKSASIRRNEKNWIEPDYDLPKANAANLRAENRDPAYKKLMDANREKAKKAAAKP